MDGGGVWVGGVSRGGVVAILQAGDQTTQGAGVLNFVGGWVGHPHPPSVPSATPERRQVEDLLARTRPPCRGKRWTRKAVSRNGSPDQP